MGEVFEFRDNSFSVRYVEKLPGQTSVAECKDKLNDIRDIETIKM